MGELGFLRPTISADLAARARLRLLWPHCEANRECRFGLPLDDERAIVAGDGPHRSLRLAGAKEKTCQNRQRRMDGRFGLTEPNHGSDPVDGHPGEESSRGLSLSGAKAWISNSPIADVFLVWAKTEDGVICGFTWRRRESLSAPATHGKVALRASITGEIVLDDVFVPQENMLPEVAV